MRNKRGNYCNVFGCRNRSTNTGADVHYYRLPAVITNQGSECEALSRERRHQWLVLLNQDFTGKNLANVRVCSTHFITGQKAYLHDQSNPDWAPSVNMGYAKTSNDALRTVQSHSRYIRKVNRHKKAKAATALLKTSEKRDNDVAVAGSDAAPYPCDIQGTATGIATQNMMFSTKVSNGVAVATCNAAPHPLPCDIQGTKTGMATQRLTFRTKGNNEVVITACNAAPHPCDIQETETGIATQKLTFSKKGNNDVAVARSDAAPNSYDNNNVAVAECDTAPHPYRIQEAKTGMATQTLMFGEKVNNNVAVTACNAAPHPCDIQEAKTGIATQTLTFSTKGNLPLRKSGKKVTVDACDAVPNLFHIQGTETGIATQTEVDLKLFQAIMSELQILRTENIDLKHEVLRLKGQMNNSNKKSKKNTGAVGHRLSIETTQLKMDSSVSHREPQEDGQHLETDSSVGYLVQQCDNQQLDINSSDSHSVTQGIGSQHRCFWM